jgi:phage repressor protein C with HTH and peptisase S24 domain
MPMSRIIEEMLRLTDGNQTMLAKELKVTQPTVSRWLSGAEPKRKHHERILVYARKKGVAEASTFDAELIVPIVGYVGAGGEILFEKGQGPFGEARMPPKNTTPTTVAVVVRGDSMAGQLENGWTVYYDRRYSPPSESLIGRLCVVGLQDGRVLIKKLLPGHANGLYVLYSVNAAPLLDQAVEWAAPVSWIAPT